MSYAYGLLETLEWLRAHKPPCPCDFGETVSLVQSMPLTNRNPNVNVGDAEFRVLAGPSSGVPGAEDDVGRRIIRVTMVHHGGLCDGRAARWTPTVL